jgi:hypothetical protein
LTVTHPELLRRLVALIVVGDHDPYNQTEKSVELFLPHGKLAVIPGCDVVLDCKGPFTMEAIRDFPDRPAGLGGRSHGGRIPTLGLRSSFINATHPKFAFADPLSQR